MERIRIAACGMDCNECGQYKITMEHDAKTAGALVGWFKSQCWIEEGEGAEAVLRKNPLCKGCWNLTDDCFWKFHCTNCGIRSCCIDKGVTHCGECCDFPCVKYLNFAEDGLVHHKKAMENLLLLNK